MSNPLPNEMEIYQQLKDEEVVISTKMWSYIFINIADVLFAMELELSFYLEKEECVPLEDMKKLLREVLSINRIFKQIINPGIVKTVDVGFVIVKQESEQLHPNVRQLLSHHISNDIQAINFNLTCNLDESIPLSIEDNEKILIRLKNIRSVLKKIEENTSKIKDKIRNKLVHPIACSDSWAKV